MEQGNFLQAKQTLQSIIENYEGEDLKKVAQDKYDKILQKEAMLEEQDRLERENRNSADDAEIELPSM
jgi:hypothetical protein